MQQMQREDEWLRLETNTLSLQAEISKLQSSQSAELSKLYDQLSESNNQNESSEAENKIKKTKIDEQEFEDQIAEINRNI